MRFRNEALMCAKRENRRRANMAMGRRRTLGRTAFAGERRVLLAARAGGALFFRRTAPLGIVILTPLVTIIFFFHLMITPDWWWGSLNLVWLAVLAWRYRHEPVRSERP
jgi:hypothetical protein